LTPLQGLQGGSAPGDVVETLIQKGVLMALYEHIFLARQDVSAQQVEDLTNQLTEVLSAGGGKVTKNEYWGLKSLAYRIKKNRKAHYSLLNIDAPAPAVAEMERLMRINEDILRFMTVRVDKLEEGPSAMMQKRDDRADRGDRGDRPDRGGDRFGGGDRRPRRF
jgi:small subunit ribosomal protein S6